MRDARITLKRGGPWLIAVLWPSFVMAIIGVGVLFSAVDPALVETFGASSERLAVYSVGFLILWAYAALSIAAGCWFLVTNAQKPRTEPDR